MGKAVAVFRGYRTPPTTEIAERERHPIVCAWEFEPGMWDRQYGRVVAFRKYPASGGQGAVSARLNTMCTDLPVLRRRPNGGRLLSGAWLTVVQGTCHRENTSVVQGICFLADYGSSMEALYETFGDGDFRVTSVNDKAS